MTALEILAAAQAALALVEKLFPLIAQLRQAGHVTAEQQEELMRKFHSLKDRADGQFAGPEWNVASD